MWKYKIGDIIIIDIKNIPTRHLYKMSKYKMVVINNTYSTISQRLYEIKPYLHSFPVSVINISKSELETYSILDLETMRDNKLNTILSSN